jgi:SAM-dependent methyltransferase
MWSTALWWLGGAAGGAAIIYWQVVVAEGAYLGPWAVRLIYSLGAPHYDEVRAAGQTEADAVLRPLLAEALTHRACPAVLDVATGTGRVPLLVTADPGFAGTVAALDLTPPMLAEARRKAPAHTPVGWVVGEAGRLPWPDSCFDLVTCLEALEYFPSPRRALAEMARVLRPGGTLIVSKWPDSWARLLPGRGLSAIALRRELAALGLVDLVLRPWQRGHYELLLARSV